MNLGGAHRKLVFDRRVKILARMLAEQAPETSSLIDIGCGDGRVSYLMKQAKPSLNVTGVEIHRWPSCAIDFKEFDGERVPFDDSSFDVSMLVDVMHHTPDIGALLMEACRVSKRYVLIKDHLCENRENFLTLKFMDWAGNKPYGVRLPYNYKSKSQWEDYFRSAKLKVVSWNEKIPIHGFPLNIFFDRRLHFMALLEKNVS